jgi:predicted ester cyclase
MSEPVRQTGGSADPKAVVQRLVDEVMNQRRLEVIDELYDASLARSARRWVEPFLKSFADIEMRVVEMVAEGERVVGRFTCSGTHVGSWLGHAATGRRFERVAEVYFFTVRDGRIVAGWGLEDLWARITQLELLDGSMPTGDEPPSEPTA